MGGFISLLVSLPEIAAELSAETAISVESILTGEALAALEAEVTSLMTMDVISGVEALAQLGFTAEQFSQFALVSSVVNEAISYGLVFQTLSGVSTLVAAGIKLALEQESIVNRNIGWSGQEPLLRHSMLAFTLDPLHWENSIMHEVGDLLFQQVSPQSRLLGLHNARDLIARGRWVVQTEKAENEGEMSGNVINIPHSPGGTYHQSAPDWMLPLILGLSGFESPELKTLEHGSKEKAGPQGAKM